MKCKIVSWNCGGGFRNKFRKLLEAYPDADVYVVSECEDPWYYDDEEYKHLFANGFRIGIKTKGLGVWVREGVTLKRLDWPNPTQADIVPVIVGGEITLIPAWTHSQDGYVEALHDYLDAFIHRFGDKTVLVGDLNSNANFDRKHGDRNHTALVARLAEIGLVDCYHHTSGESQGKETVPTYYHRRKPAEPFHIDHIFANPDLVADFEIAPTDTHTEWLEYSDHMPLQIVIDTEPQVEEPEKEDEAKEMPSDRYYDENGVLHIIRTGVTMAQAQAEWEARQREKNKQRMFITVQGGPTFTGSYGVALVEFIKYLGWEAVRDMNFEANHGPLIAEGKKGKWWLEVAPGWQVNCNLNANSMRITAYTIAKAFGRTISVHWS